ncbi:unnamed protein product, partial [Ectocarpus fasciculatus]
GAVGSAGCLAGDGPAGRERRFGRVSAIHPHPRQDPAVCSRPRDEGFGAGHRFPAQTVAATAAGQRPSRSRASGGAGFFGAFHRADAQHGTAKGAGGTRAVRVVRHDGAATQGEVPRADGRSAGPAKPDRVRREGGDERPPGGEGRVFRSGNCRAGEPTPALVLRGHPRRRQQGHARGLGALRRRVQRGCLFRRRGTGRQRQARRGGSQARPRRRLLGHLRAQPGQELPPGGTPEGGEGGSCRKGAPRSAQEGEGGGGGRGRRR